MAGMFDIMPRPLPQPLTAPALAAALLRDARTYSPQAALLRLTRKWAARRMAADIAALTALGPYKTHVAAVAPVDPLFCLSHRHYLITNLSDADRLRAALHHYTTESLRFTQAYHAALASPQGLTLWSERVADVDYAIVMTPAQDVLYEGGSGLMLTVNGARIAVLSFSWLPAGLVGNDAAQPMITRKQLTQARDHQAAFNSAFDRATPGHLLLAAFAAFAHEIGHDAMLGLAVGRHPAATPAVMGPMQAAYDTFWADLGGTPLPGPDPAAWRMPLPLALTPLSDVSASHRRRAAARRAHMDRIAAAATAVIRPLILTPA
jgi:uncharacterized protein VirK/YbjX